MTLLPGAKDWFLGPIPRVKFQGKTYLFIGSWPISGAIATEDQFLSFTDSFAHLYEDGAIRRYNKVIGHQEDLELVK